MSYLVLVLLSLLWLGFFLPGLLQARRSSPYVSASDFQQSLTRISTGVAVDASTVPTAVPARTRRSRREIARRRDTLLGLMAAVVAGVALGLSFGGLLRLLAVPPALALIVYVTMLRVEAAKRRAVRGRRRVASHQQRPVRAAVDADADGVVPSVARRTTAVSDAVAEADLERLAG